MTPSDDVGRIVAALAASEVVRPHLLSVIWIGSSSHGLDPHARSDVDIQLVLDAPTAEVTVALSQILRPYRNIDLSILYPKDVCNPFGELDFQDGTKGAFFIHVLSRGQVLYGLDFYATLRGELPIGVVQASIRFTIREYLSRLRVMALTEDKTASFKKYTMKYIKDVLVYAGHLPLETMTGVANSDLVRLARETGMIDGTIVGRLWDELLDYETPLELSARAQILVCLEAMYDTLGIRPPTRTKHGLPPT